MIREEERERRPQYVPILTVPGQINADLQKAVLDGYGIPVMYRSQTITNPFLRSVNVGPMGEITLMVPEDLADEARAILEMNREAEDDYPAQPGQAQAKIRRIGLLILICFTLPFLVALVRIWQELGR
jgi:hypothetical protein